MISKPYTALSLIFSMFLLFSCSNTEDGYKDFIKNGERIYPGKVFEVEAQPGLNRVKLNMKIYPDPNVESVWVKWSANGKMDSLQTDMNKGSQFNVAEILINNLEENSYTFYITTTDGKGNRSVPTEMTARVYGNTYQRSLRSAFVQEALYEDDMLKLKVNKASDTVSLGSEFFYVDKSGKVATVFVEEGTNSFEISDFKQGSPLSYRSWYVPQSNALDTFYTAKAPLRVGRYLPLENSKVPFVSATRSGRWGTLAGWTTNAAAKIHPGGNGGWDEWNSNIFNLESGWGAPAKVTNGKIYKTMVLQPGDYEFKISDLRDTNLQDSDRVYLVAANGSTIPDYENISTALAYTSVIQGKSVADLKISFTVTEAQEVSFGYLSNQSGDKFANIRAFQLKYFPL